MRAVAAQPTADAPVVDLIRRLQAREVKGSSLSGDDRRLCVEYLTSEGYSVAEIAGILHIADRTVHRDRQRIRSANSVARDPSLVSEMVGRLIGEAETTVSRLRRVARDRATPAAVKVEAERACWTSVRELVSTLQRLGYLPTAATRLDVRAGVSSAEELEAPEYEELHSELERLQGILALPPAGGPVGGGGPAGGELDSHASTCVIDGQALARLSEVKDRVARLAAGEQIRALETEIQRAQQEQLEAQEARNANDDD
jgi:transposase